jgi:hypothetical protein
MYTVKLFVNIFSEAINTVGGMLMIEEFVHCLNNPLFLIVFKVSFTETS